MQTVKVQLPVGVDGVEAAGQPAPRFWLWTSFSRANTAHYYICIDENGKRMKLRGLGQIRGVGRPATGLAETAQQAWLEEQHRRGTSRAGGGGGSSSWGRVDGVGAPCGCRACCLRVGQ